MSKSTRSLFRLRFRSSLLAASLLLPSLAAAAQDKSCLDVQVGSARSFDCINRGLRDRAAEAHAPADTSVTTATSAPNRVGTFNQSAVREYLGNSFGHSAIPQPHLHTYVPPIAPTHP